MQKLDHYIIHRVVSTIFMVLLVVITLQTFFSFIEEVANAGKGDYTTFKVIEYILLTTPRKLYELFPIACLVGSLMGLGGLAAHSELTVMRSAGISVQRIAYAALKGAIGLLIVSVVLGEVLMPPLERLAAQRKAVAISGQLNPIGRGVWVRDKGEFIYLENAVDPGLLQSVKRIRLDDDFRPVGLSTADVGEYQEDHWRLSDVVHTDFADDHVAIERLATEDWYPALAPSMLEWVATRPEMLSAVDLIRYRRYLERNQLHARRYELAFWSKVLAPLATVIMVLVAVPFAFGSNRSGHGGRSLFLGIIGGVGFYMLNRLATNLGMVYPIPAFLCAALPITLFAVGGSWLLYRSN